MSYLNKKLLYSLFISLAISIGILAILNIVKQQYYYTKKVNTHHYYTSKDQIKVPIKKKNIKDLTLEEREVYHQNILKKAECRKKSLNNNSYEKCIETKKEIEKKSAKEPYIPQVNNNEFKDVWSIIRNSNILIYSIYALLFLSITMQFYLLLLSREETPLRKLHFNISEWNINTPPILGIVGTISSFAILVGSNNISQSFFNSFFDAVLTTILGGFFYVINMFLKIYICETIE